MTSPISPDDPPEVQKAFVNKARNKLGVLIGAACVVLLWYMTTYKYEESFFEWMTSKYDVHGHLVPQWVWVAIIFVIALVVDFSVPEKKKK